ncbi:GntR family transcriptional regulator [Streptomyces pluripotens]|uniref:GntR family transcriptional regulator n=1 Tax=Streptomyces pluripotens TaxID=1355015 RepID=A0A221P6M5_9ACTN|nr:MULTISPECIES: GntR family transcriptional regulator [Streptomyces]ARP73541.1 GntR family transcriptional regulator [Streptomyces pluripotens]ASN27792.1 GntR family transcriptional regulator [Streptomyces pluripotens]KIE26808.1 GntR family transcriptional regulator [Streptomyces sp. MUSC 125]MCH0557283.1 GntR family transcriptional regulator [Streptomyces sp. MUM 16J]
MARTTPHHPPQLDSRPRYAQVAALLLDELHDGTIPPGERLPGERHLAAHFGVSRETVRQALEMLRRGGLVATDRRGSHATLPGRPVETPDSLTFPVGARSADPYAVDRATVTWEVPPLEHARALDLAPHRPTLVHRYRSATPDGRSLRTAVTSFSAVALAEVEELARYRDRADGATPAQLRRAYDWMRRAGLTLHHRDSIIQVGNASSVRVTRRVHDQYARPLEITDLVVDAGRNALVYEFTLPAAG